MNAIPQQEGTWVVGRGVAQRGIGIGATPGQDGSAVDDQIAGEASPQRRAYQQHEEGFALRGSSSALPLTLLGWAGHAWLTTRLHGQPTGQRKGRPGAQPIMDFLVGQPPEGAQER